jgi:hypothetical protein
MKKEQRERERDYSYSRKKEILRSKTFRVGQSKANNTNRHHRSVRNNARSI